MKAIIVDDEESARLTLGSILERYFREVEVVGEANSASKALALITEKNPDLVFLDIQMGNESGFDVLEAMVNRNFQIIVVSAEKQHAYESFRFNVAHYLLKPVRINELRLAIDKVKETMKTAAEEEEAALLRPISQEQFRLQLVIPELTGVSFAKLSEIIRCEGSGNYTHFTMVENRKVTASKNLKEFEDLLLPHGFVRIHKSHIINTYHLSRYIKGRGGEVIMADGTTIPVSRDRKDPFMDNFLK
jgi:two-component system, LytTR family, response regulator